MDFKKIYQPNREFKEKTKSLFLLAAREKFGQLKVGQSFAFKYFIRGAAMGVAFMLLLASAATYADQKNVGPESILYPLKRSQEVIKVAFSKQEEKPALHLKLAKRRLDEIKEVKSKNPKSPQVASLVADLKDEVNHSYETIQANNIKNSAPINPISQPVATLASTSSRNELNSQSTSSEQTSENQNQINNLRNPKGKSGQTHRELPDSKKVSLCESWSDIIGDDDLSVEQVVSETPDAVSHFNTECKSIVETIIQNQKDFKSNQDRDIQEQKNNKSKEKD